MSSSDEDIKDKIKLQIGELPNSSEAESRDGNADCPKDPKPEGIVVNPKGKNAGAGLQMETDDSDDDAFREASKIKDSDTEGSNYSDEEHSSQDNIEDQYKSVKIKSYSSILVKEEPVENFKLIFKEANLEFEKRKYHQQIFEEIVQESSNINAKDLQEQYLSYLHEAAQIEIFTCCLCKYETMNMINLKCHLLIAHNGKMESEVFRCNICNYEATYRSHMRNHMVKHKKVKKVSRVKKKRTKRGEATVKKSSSSRYMKKISNTERYPCSSCSYVGRSEEKLKKHTSVHKDRSNCDLCSFQSNDKEVLQKHKDTHKEGDKKFKCYMCTYTITNKATLGRHLLNVHKIANEASKRSKMCEICSFSCSSKNQLQIHYLTHKTVKDLKEDEIFKCPEPGCGHQTKLKCHLRVHMKTHKAPDFVCEICGLATRRKESYRNHLVTHKRLSEIEWLRCSICPYQARNKKLLRRHMRKGDHSGKPLRHIRNRDRKREAEETGVNIEQNKEKVVKTKRRRRKKNMDTLEQIVEQIDGIKDEIEGIKDIRPEMSEIKVDMEEMKDPRVQMIDLKDHRLNIFASLGDMT